VFVAREAEVWPRASVGAGTKIRRGARAGLGARGSILARFAASVQKAVLVPCCDEIIPCDVA
jgi:hypothetical protein